MAAFSAELFDLLVSHQIGLTRFSNGAVRRAIAQLNKADADLFARLNAALNDAPESATVDDLDSLLSSVRSLNAQAYKQVGRSISDEMKGIAGYEANWQELFYGQLVPVKTDLAQVTAEQAYAAAYSRPFQGRLLKEWASGIEANRMTRIRDTVRMGYFEGKTTSDIVADVRGTRAKGYEDGVIEIDRRHAETIVRSALSHTAGTARNKFFEANSDILGEEVWLSTLDGKTSEQCMIRDHLHYTQGDHKPVGHDIPWGAGPGKLHFNCRSSSIALLKDQKNLFGTRASKDGQVDANLSYGDWLKSQPAHVQDDVLGTTRGKLLRDGELSVESFANDKGKFYTLDELREKDAAAFERAGL